MARTTYYKKMVTTTTLKLNKSLMERFSQCSLEANLSNSALLRILIKEHYGDLISASIQKKEE